MSHPRIAYAHKRADCSGICGAQVATTACLVWPPVRSCAASAAMSTSAASGTVAGRCARHVASHAAASGRGNSTCANRGHLAQFKHPGSGARPSGSARRARVDRGRCARSTGRPADRAWRQLGARVETGETWKARSSPEKRGDRLSSARSALGDAAEERHLSLRRAVEAARPGHHDGTPTLTAFGPSRGFNIDRCARLLAQWMKARKTSHMPLAHGARGVRSRGSSRGLSRGLSLCPICLDIRVAVVYCRRAVSACECTYLRMVT
jgi:hypothetical protein